ncbi:CHASE2 domain-containing protein [Croceivirga thetidis]|uniref:CHASE2 domain-containing protein n=1 Tax=Croceivirga thetidis TaxID=2721623 RepID=A0ABX1GMX9_9FLAO|nr:CHASE2 domain-containing protein [Croceivirga thetidis]NKI30989.1 CHASE2 domain-containing protein [Croceivirga thetidis]
MTKNKATKKEKRKRRRILLIKDALFCTLLSLLTFALFSSILFSISYFNPLLHSFKDFSFLDAYYQVFNSNGDKTNENLVLVNIEDLNREEIANLIEIINKTNPALIGVDIVFRQDGNSETTEKLKSQLSKQNVIRASILSDSLKSVVSDDNTTSGYVNLTTAEATGIIRSFVGITESKGTRQYAFAAQLVRKWNSGQIWNTNGLERKLKERKRIKFYGNFQSFSHLNARTILQGKHLDKLKGKLVIVGYMGFPTGNPYDVEDKHFTPLNQHPLGKGIPDMYGITIHANIANMLLNDDFFLELSMFEKGILIFLFSYMVSIYFLRLDRKLKISYRTVRKLVLFVFAFCFVGICLWLFQNNVALEPTIIIIMTIYTAGFVKYYKHLIRYLKTKFEFKSYIK